MGVFDNQIFSPLESRTTMVQQHYRIAPPPIIYEILDGEVVILNLEAGIYYNLKESGAEIWQLLQNGASLEQIAAYYEGAEDVRAEIDSFLKELLAEKIIIFSEESELVNPIERRPFRRPVLHRYSDMQELLLLDPIHEVDQIGWPAKK